MKVGDSLMKKIKSDVVFCKDNNNNICWYTFRKDFDKEKNKKGLTEITKREYQQKIKEIYK